MRKTVFALCLYIAGVSGGFAADEDKSKLEKIMSLAKSQTNTIFASDNKENKLSTLLRAVAKAAKEKQLKQLFESKPRRQGGLQLSRLLQVDLENECVAVDVTAAQDTQALVSQIKAIGAYRVSSSGAIVSACIPHTALEYLANSKAVHFMMPAIAIPNVGLVTSQGDRSMRTDEVRNFTGVNGEGVRVGVLTDSFECLEGPLFPGNPFTTVSEDIANDDLPSDVRVLSDSTSENCIDEGRAELQLIHDVAPSATGAFHTAEGGQPAFADGIKKLAYQAGADVIVDSFFYLAEPMFSDGVIAQAIDTVKGWGIPYFSSAGNQGRNSYEVASIQGVPTIPFDENVIYNFAPPDRVPDFFQEVTILPFEDTGENTAISFQWDQPFRSVTGKSGAESDLGLLFFFEPRLDIDNLVPFCSANPDGSFSPPVCQFQEGSNFNNIGTGEPVDLIFIQNLSGEAVTVNISIFLFEGREPTRFKYVWFGSSFIPNQYDTRSPTIYGHPNADGAEAVGASAFFFTEELLQPELGNDLDLACIPACLNFFSSAGGVPILFDGKGNRLQNPKLRPKPGITGPDGGNTTFLSVDSPQDDDDFPNFFGTSASAPHVAAATALAISARGEGIAQNGKFRMCSPDGNNIQVDPSEVLSLLNNKARFRDCDALQPDGYVDALHATAQDMRFRIGIGGGALTTANGDQQSENDQGGNIGVIRVPNAKGFDADTGFGFIDGVEFIDAVTDK